MVIRKTRKYAAHNSKKEGEGSKNRQAISKKRRLWVDDKNVKGAVSSKLSQGPVLGPLPFSSSLHGLSHSYGEKSHLYARTPKEVSPGWLFPPPLSCRLTYSAAYFTTSLLWHSFHKPTMSTHHGPGTVLHRTLVQRRWPKVPADMELTFYWHKIHEVN